METLIGDRERDVQITMKHELFYPQLPTYCFLAVTNHNLAGCLFQSILRKWKRVASGAKCHHNRNECLTNVDHRQLLLITRRGSRRDVDYLHINLAFLPKFPTLSSRLMILRPKDNFRIPGSPLVSFC